MPKDISDSIELNGKAVLKRGVVLRNRLYLDGCHAENNSDLLRQDFETTIGSAAIQAGYKIGEEFEYTITILKKKY